MALGFDDIPETALAWHRDGRGAALATVVQTWGSAPRGVGSQLAISGKGEISGSVSGGCVEGAVVVEAVEALDTGKPVLLDYGVTDDEAFAVGLAVASHSFQRIVLALLLYLLLDYKATIEEEMLAKIHEGYSAYQSLVPKFLPNILFLMRSDTYLSNAFVEEEEVSGDFDSAAATSLAAVGEVTSGTAPKAAPTTTTEEAPPKDEDTSQPSET